MPIILLIEEVAVSSSNEALEWANNREGLVSVVAVCTKSGTRPLTGIRFSLSFAMICFHIPITSEYSGNIGVLRHNSVSHKGRSRGSRVTLSKLGQVPQNHLYTHGNQDCYHGNRQRIHGNQGLHGKHGGKKKA